MVNRFPKRIIYILTLILTIGAIIVGASSGNFENTKLKIDIADPQPAGFIVDNVFYPQEDFPLTSASAEDGKPVTIQGTIPDYVTGSYSISFQSLYSACEFIIDGRVIKTYAVNRHLSFTRMTGNIYVIVPLSEAYRGKTFTIRMTPYFSSANMGLLAPVIAPTGEIKLSILNKNLPRLIIVITLITIALFSLALSVAQVLEKSVINSKLFANFLAMDIFVTLWLICSSDLPQFFTSGNDLVSLVSFMSLALMGVPYMGYCEQIFPKHRKFFLTLQTVGVVIALTNIALCITGLFDPMEILIFTHLYMAAAMISSLIIAITEDPKTMETWFLITGIALLFISAFGGIVFYYTNPASGADGLFFGAGFICFITSLFLLILSRQVTLIKERRHLDTYKTMAYSDLLTTLGNRSAFEHCFETLGERVTVGEPVTLLMFDLNGLKSTNDTYGHQAGDEMISTMAMLLERHFLRYGSCYRIGGDEYAVIVERVYLNFAELCEQFQTLLSETKLSCGVELSSSIGFASMPYNTNPNFRDVIYQKADEAMYEEKKKYHLEHERRKA